MNEDDILTTKQLAERLNVSVYTVRNYVRDRKLPPPIDPGSSKHLFRWGLVQTYLHKRERKMLKAMGTEKAAV